MSKLFYVLIITFVFISLSIFGFLIHSKNRVYDVKITNTQYDYPWVNITISAYEDLPKIEMAQASIIGVRLWEEPINIQLELGDNLHLNLNVTGSPITTGYNTGWISLFYENGERSSLEFEIELNEVKEK